MCDTPRKAWLRLIPVDARPNCEVESLLRALRPEEAAGVTCARAATREFLLLDERSSRRGFRLCARCAETVSALFKVRGEEV